MQKRTLIFLSLLPALALLHAPVLLGDFVWDDHAMVAENPELSSLGNIPAMFQRNYFGERANVGLFRPLVNVSLAVDYQLWGGDNAAGYHLTNLLLHLLGGLLFYLFLRRLTARPWFAEAAALLFLVHPAAAEPVGWIVARGDSLAFVLIMATMLFHLMGRKRPAWHLLALVTYTLALFAKLAAGPLPLLLLLVEWCVRGLQGRDLFRPATLWRYASYAVPILLYAVVRENAMGTLVPHGVGVTWRDVDSLSAVTVGFALLFRYAGLFLLPVGMCADYSADPLFVPGEITGIASSPVVFFMAAATVGLVVLAIMIRRRSPWIALGILWFFVALLPVSQVVRIGAVMADRHFYIPSAGGALVLVTLLFSLPRRRVICGVLILISFALLTIQREAVWRSDLTMIMDVLSDGNYPQDDEAVNRLGLYRGRAGDLKGEEAAYRRGLELSPGNRYLLKNLGGVLLETGRIREAEGVLQLAFRQPQRRDRQKAAIAYNLSLALIALDEKPAAALVLEEAVRCLPPLELAFTRLGRLYRDDLDRPERGALLLRQAEAIRSMNEQGRTPR